MCLAYLYINILESVTYIEILLFSYSKYPLMFLRLLHINAFLNFFILEPLNSVC